MVISNSTILDGVTDNPDYSWDKKTQRYRNKQTGRFVRADTVANLSKQRIELIKKDLSQIGNLLINRKINLQTWQSETAIALKSLHGQQYVLGRGGMSQIKKEDYLEIGRELRVQYKYLRNFAYDLKQGKVSEKQFKRRVQMYADSSKVSFFRGKSRSAKEAGYTHAKRFLGIAEHCPDCLRYHARGVVPISELVLPTQACVCGSQCRCNVLYLRLEEAIKS